jgi:hypothetical protein
MEYDDFERIEESFRQFQVHTEFEEEKGPDYGAGGGSGRPTSPRTDGPYRRSRCRCRGCWEAGPL